MMVTMTMMVNLAFPVIRWACVAGTVNRSWMEST